MMYGFLSSAVVWKRGVQQDGTFQIHYVDNFQYAFDDAGERSSEHAYV